MPLIKPRKKGAFPWSLYIAFIGILVLMDKISDYYGFRGTWNSVKLVVFVVTGLLGVLFWWRQSRRRS